MRYPDRLAAAHLSPEGSLLIGLDDDRCLDHRLVGAKAARLARARRTGIPVLPGFVVNGSASTHHMKIGAAALTRRGSGGARLEVMSEPLPIADDLVAAGSRLGPRLVARSSTSLEASGRWSGAFTSYLDLTPDELPRAIVGCWASAFSVQAISRQRAENIEPGSFPMSVLVQPALSPASGGTAMLDEGGRVTVHTVEGSPAPLLQGWSQGAEARWDGRWIGEEAISLLGADRLDAIASLVRRAHQVVGADRCEWALDDDIWILQLDSVPAPPALDQFIAQPRELDPILLDVARTVTRAPGALGEELVLPWALAGLPRTLTSSVERPATALARARHLCEELTAEVWGCAAPQARSLALETLERLRTGDPSPALARIRRLRPPDTAKATTLLSLVDGMRQALVGLGAFPDPGSAWYATTHEVERAAQKTPTSAVDRVGVSGWEPFVASVVLAGGHRHRGTPAAPGIGAGRRHSINGPDEAAWFSPREVIATPQPVPNLAPFLWDSAGLVTESGSPAAHLFESARSLGVPAVCGVSSGETDDEIVAVDGYSGVVSTTPLFGGA
ncbi:MAG: PEP/pyruvate-binding domain-containing protein [Acidimicrobiia bacterium]